MKKIYLVFLLFFACTSNDTEELKEVIYSRSVSTEAACEDITAGNGLSLVDCKVVLGGSDITTPVTWNFIQGDVDGGFAFGSNDTYYYLQDHVTGANTNLNFNANLFELNLQGSELLFTLQNSPWIVTGLSSSPSVDKISNVGSILRYGTINPLSVSAVKAGSFSAAGSSTAVVSLGSTSPTTTYKISITPTSSGAAVAFYISSKTATNFTVTYPTPVVGTCSFDWIVTP